MKGKSNRKKTAILIALLVAVAAAAFGVLKMTTGTVLPVIFSDPASGSEQIADGSGQAGGEEADEASGQDGNGGSEPAESDRRLITTLFFASDYQPDKEFDDPAATLASLLRAAADDGKDIDRVIICGDYTNDSKLHDYQLSPDAAIEEIREVAAAECPDLGRTGSGDTAGESASGEKAGSDAAAGGGNGTGRTNSESSGSGGRTGGNTGSGRTTGAEAPGIMFVQGNHDKMTDNITPTGLYEADGCLIYILNTQDDFPWKQGKTMGCLAKVKASSAEMKACFDELIKNGETRPVFIAGHVPLHFTARTSSRHSTGDNLYSSLIFDVVNDAAKSLDIVYLFGHNHSKGWDCYLGGSSVYRAKGDKILIPRFNETQITSDEYDERTLNFTYMNAGYTGYYRNCSSKEYDKGTADQYHAADEALTGTVFEIFGDRIVVTRYDTEGVHVLGHAGEADPYKGGIDAGLIDEDSYSGETASPQTIERND